MATIDIEISQHDTTTSETFIRGHRIVVDRPREKGGNDRGPMGGELLLAGIGGCFMSNLLAAIRSRAVTIQNINTKVTATIAENPARFSAIEICVFADQSDVKLLEKLVSIAERSCIAANTVRDGVQLTVKIATSDTSV